jgi:hypothetical protein
MDGRQKYMMFKEIVEHAIECGGQVFGGYVRDFLIHEDAAKRFYAQNYTKEQYSDKEVSPDTLDRFLTASDVDVKFETVEQYNNFRNLLTGAYYKVIAIPGVSTMYTDDETVPVRVKKLKVGFDITSRLVIRSLDLPNGSIARGVLIPELVRRLEGMSITSDIINIDVLLTTAEPPFNKLDFRCNGLIMDKNGIHICKDLKRGLNAFGVHRVYQRILEDIKHKRAVLVNLYPHRWDKMEAKGWDLVGGNVEKVAVDNETCLICHDDIKRDDAYRLACCTNVNYHFECLSRQITHPVTGIVDSEKCPHCRQSVLLTSTEVQVFGMDIVNVF